MTAELDPGLPCLQDAKIEGKVVLIRVDHNVVKGGAIKDPYRIDATIPTLYSVVEKGGRPILMTHIGRPRDKKTGKIRCDPATSVEPIIDYLEQKLQVRFFLPRFHVDPDKGIAGIDNSIDPVLKNLRKRSCPGIYLPNVRWFSGEESKGEDRQQLAIRFSGLADLFVNDAFGSWQAHASTHEITKHLPSFAGLLMQKEMANLHQVLEPTPPFVAIVAGAKADTKIGPLKALHKKADHLILGGILYNAYLSARYDVRIKGVSPEQTESARELVSMDRAHPKIVELPYILESETLDEKAPGRYRTIRVEKLKRKRELNYILDVDPRSFDDKKVVSVLNNARTFFVNAVMGLAPHFLEGTEALYTQISKNEEAFKLFGGGDTLKEFRNLCPGQYLSAQEDPKSYFFTGGGSVLTAIQKGSPYELPTVQALIANGGKDFSTRPS